MNQHCMLALHEFYAQAKSCIQIKYKVKWKQANACACT